MLLIAPSALLAYLLIMLYRARVGSVPIRFSIVGSLVILLGALIEALAVQQGIGILLPSPLTGSRDCSSMTS